MSNCRSCGAPIDWQKTAKGKNIPMNPTFLNYRDYKPGMFITTAEGDTYKIDGRKIEANPEHYKDLKGRVSHWSTCPNSADHKKK